MPKTLSTTAADEAIREHEERLQRLQGEERETEEQLAAAKREQSSAIANGAAASERAILGERVRTLADERDGFSEAVAFLRSEIGEFRALRGSAAAAEAMQAAEQGADEVRRAAAALDKELRAWVRGFRPAVERLRDALAPVRGPDGEAIADTQLLDVQHPGGRVVTTFAIEAAQTPAGARFAARLKQVEDEFAGPIRLIGTIEQLPAAMG